MSRELAPDWILKETLEVQRQASMAWKGGEKGGGDGGLTLTVLGCGTMGIAILGGILDSLKNPSSDSSGSTETVPARLPTKFNACVRSSRGAKRVKDELAKYDGNLVVYENDNLTAVKEADVVLLGCKPYMIKDVLGASNISSALEGKVLVSICAGVTETQLEEIVNQGSSDRRKCTIVRAMPNTAAAVRESMTVIGTTSMPLSQETDALITWMFTRIGRVAHIPSANMDVCTALCGSGPAFVAVMVESMATGAIAMGLPRDEAYMMANQTVRGMTGLLQSGEHPAVLRDKVTTPGGCTIGGLLVLEEGNFRGTVAKAVREATVVASQLGQGKQGVNGTRH